MDLHVLHDYITIMVIVFMGYQLWRHWRALQDIRQIASTPMIIENRILALRLYQLRMQGILNLSLFADPAEGLQQLWEQLGGVGRQPSLDDWGGVERRGRTAESEKAGHGQKDFSGK